MLKFHAEHKHIHTFLATLIADLTHISSSKMPLDFNFHRVTRLTGSNGFASRSDLPNFGSGDSGPAELLSSAAPHLPHVIRFRGKSHPHPVPVHHSNTRAHHLLLFHQFSRSQDQAIESRHHRHKQPPSFVPTLESSQLRLVQSQAWTTKPHRMHLMLRPKF